jgi:hypothetical protein
VGYHTDRVSGFPFESLGLPDNHRRLRPAVLDLGFEPDPAFLGAESVGLRAGIAEADRGMPRAGRCCSLEGATISPAVAAALSGAAGPD